MLAAEPYLGLGADGWGGVLSVVVAANVLQEMTKQQSPPPPPEATEVATPGDSSNSVAWAAGHAVGRVATSPVRLAQGWQDFAVAVVRSRKGTRATILRENGEGRIELWPGGTQGVI